MYECPYFIKNKLFKEERSKERKEINEKYVLIAFLYEESKT